MVSVSIIGWCLFPILDGVRFHYWMVSVSIIGWCPFPILDGVCFHYWMVSVSIIGWCPFPILDGVCFLYWMVSVSIIGWYPFPILDGVRFLYWMVSVSIIEWCLCPLLDGVRFQYWMVSVSIIGWCPFPILDGVRFQYCQVLVSFLFSERSDFSLIWLFYSLICCFLLFIMSMAYFSMPNSIPISSLHILTVCIWVFNSFSFLANSLMSTYIRWLIFSCDLWSLYFSAHFLNMWVGWVLWNINLCRLLNAKSIFIQIIIFFFKQFSVTWVHSFLSKTFLFQAIQFKQTVLIQTIQFSVSRVSVSKTVLFQAIQFSIDTQFKSKNSIIAKLQ